METKDVKRLHQHNSLTDILIQVEDFFDNLDLYVFQNWLEGEVFEGPQIKRYWVNLTLKYKYEDMPDPQGAIRLLKHGAKVLYRKEEEEVPIPIKNAGDYRPGEPGKPRMTTETVWLIDISIPRKFIEELDDADLATFDDEEINTDDISDARDDNIDQDDMFKDDALEDDADATEEANDEE